MLKKAKNTNNEGFTIIEVMIVLAIAALILLIVFLAVPALQRSSRNTQRRNDASNAMTSIANYISNNNGSLPTTSATLVTALSDWKPGYYPNTSAVFYGNNASIPTTASDGSSPAGSATVLTTENMIFEPGTVCSGTTATTSGASPRAYTLIYAVESGSSATPQCIGS